ncbi:MAG: helix-turn-helix domain-containing protein [Acidimicrobiia bacterium]|nr:helix-turn-helix domain-containing protein [Acidimicrobiia bacterium]
MFQFDFTTTSLEGDGTIARIEFKRGKPPAKRPRKTPKAQMDALNSGELVATLLVRFFADPDGPELAGVREVALSTTRETITPTLLHRLAWEHWLTAADAFARTGGADVEHLAKAIRLAAKAPGRPGRRGHDPNFLPSVAERYLQLRARADDASARAPVVAIAKEHNVARNTAAGWVKRCRELGYLPPARPGRAG